MVCMAMALCVSCKKDNPEPSGGGTGGGNTGGGGGGTGITGTIAGHEYVDLGLPSGLLWATCNIGADSPEDYGDYYAWGETETKSTYNLDTYKWWNYDWDNHHLMITKYNTDSEYGTVDNKTVLEPEDDAAHVNWGGGWRMPTLDEMEELVNCCTWEWTTQNGVNGKRATGLNGKSIFLPATGEYHDEYDSLCFAGYYGYFWSSSLKTVHPNDAYELSLSSDDLCMGDPSRSFGLSVRPVFGTHVVSAPTVTTSSVSKITQTTAVCDGKVIFGGGSVVTARGVCWSTSQNPTVSGNHTIDGSGMGSFISFITGLTANTTYYVRAYATNNTGTSYGEQKSFTTQSGGGGGGVIAGHEYVDLGLPSGLLWATCNVGADSPEDYGSYFAWGETETKSTYDYSTYKWCNGDYDNLTKYNTDSDYGTVDNKTVLEPEDDAAHVNWGGGWRMPTEDEWRELENNCTLIWTFQNGKNGYFVIGSNGNSIFLPAAGEYYIVLGGAGSYGYYWSSSLYTDSPSSAYFLVLTSNHLGMYDNGRCNGLSVRPVCQSQK